MTGQGSAKSSYVKRKYLNSSVKYEEMEKKKQMIWKVEKIKIAFNK